MKSTISSLRIDIPHTTKEERRIDQIAGAITWPGYKKPLKRVRNLKTRNFPSPISNI